MFFGFVGMFSMYFIFLLVCRAYRSLFHPVWAGSIAAAKELLESGADPNAQNIHFNSPLHLACQRGNKSMIDLLIHAGANCNLENADCATCCDVIEPLKKPSTLLCCVLYDSSPSLES